MERDFAELGKILRERRETIGLTRSAVARQIGISPSYISMVERAIPRAHGNPSQPSEEVIRQWSRALGWENFIVEQLIKLSGHHSEDSKKSPDSQLSFASREFHYPNPKRLERDQLLTKLDGVINAAGASEQQWHDTIRILDSFLTWVTEDLRQETESSRKITLHTQPNRNEQLLQTIAEQQEEIINLLKELNKKMNNR